MDKTLRFTLRKKSFTLLEIVIAMTLIVLGSFWTGTHLYGQVKKKQFRSETERLFDRIATAKKMAVAMDADWKGVFRLENGSFVFEAFCTEISGKRLKPLSLTADTIIINQRNVESFEIEFSSSGQVSPNIALTLKKGEQKASQSFF